MNNHKLINLIKDVLPQPSSAYGVVCSLYNYYLALFFVFLEASTSKVPKSQPKLVVCFSIKWSVGHWRHNQDGADVHERMMIPHLQFYLS